jgi:arylsulfatase
MKSWPEILNKAGYRTAAIGKMHFYPWDSPEGFQDRIISEDKRHTHIQDDYQNYLKSKGMHKYHGMDHKDYLVQKGAVVSRIPLEDQVDTWVADQTISYLAALDQDQSFAVIAGFPGPHCPYDPPAEHLDQVDLSQIKAPVGNPVDWMKSDADRINRMPWNGVDYSDASQEDYLRIRHHYLALVKQIDDAVGLILNYLDQSGLAETTTVVFTSDHGDFLGDHDLIGKRYFLDQAVSVPLLIRGAGFTPGTQVDSLVNLTDVYNTIFSIAGIESSPSEDCQILDGSENPERYIFGALDTGFFAAWKNWRLSRYYNGEAYLFNLEADPLENNNLILDKTCSEILNQLDRRLSVWILESSRTAHLDKKVVPATDNAEDPFNQAGWTRPYPFPHQG